MAIELFNHETCVTSSRIKSAYCAEMSTALNVGYTQYMIPLTILSTADILSVFLAVGTLVNGKTEYLLKKVINTNWTIQTGNKISILNQDPNDLQLRNRIIVIPKNAINLCFTGVAGSNISNKRPVWLKRSDTSKMYDYLAVTSIDYFQPFWSILEYPNVQFTNGVGSGFTNLTTQHKDMKIDFDGQYVGAINSVTSTSTLTIDNPTFSSVGPSRAFMYAQGTLEFAVDVNGAPSTTWSRHLALPQIDHDIPYKFWLRDFKAVSNDLTVYANNAIRILGTEFLL